MNRFAFLFTVAIAIVILACNKVEPKKFHENTCEAIGALSDSAILDDRVFKMSATVNSSTEVWLRLEGDTVASFDSLVSHWIQVKSSDECYQANTFKSRTELGETYLVVDYIVPTFIVKGYPVVWYLEYKGVPYYLNTTLK
ncbi:MAG: hypothetical protein LPK45_01165 [Bacteroidota bacterium]|nr:hypothetical protein [Bacteroidota bacterium]MDX5429641.1 hypothetical protein [Bacteroidota bacterium]MDX5468422.1 hypothetical protein [Bacteroidota bacterium]